MPFDADQVRQLNETSAAIPLSDVRLRELPVELAQLSGTIERVRSRLAFGMEAADFVSALDQCARPRSAR